MTRPSPYAGRGRTLAAALALGFGASAALTLSSPSAAEGPDASASPSASSEPPPGGETEPPPEEPPDREPFPDMAIDLTPRSGPPGAEVRVTGVGVWCYDSGQERTNRVRIDWVRGGSGWVYDDPAEGNGSIAVTLTVPDVAPGANGVEVSCPNEGDQRTEQFTVEAEPTPSTPPSQPPTTTPTVSSPPAIPPTPIVERRLVTTRVTSVAPRATPTSAPTPTPARTSTPTPRPTTSPPPAAAVPSSSPPAAPAPSAERAGVPPISKSEFLPPLDRLSFDWLTLVLTAAVAIMLIILVAFPADIFNKTYEACRKEIHSLLRVKLLRKILAAPAWYQGAMLILTAVTLWFLFSHNEGPAAVKGSLGNGNIVAQTIALLVAIPLVMAVYTAPGELYLRRLRKAVLRVPPVALAVAVVCGAISYRFELEPVYAYGLFAMFVARHNAPKVPENQRARGVLFSFLSLAALVLVCYYGFTVNFAPTHSGSAGWTAVMFDAICYWIVVLGAECLIFTLLPMRFLDGRTLAGWSLWLWTGLQLGAAVFFWTVLNGKAAADPTKINDEGVPKAILFFVIFGVLSLAFWAYFRWPNRPTRHRGDHDAPPLADMFRLAAALRRYRDELVVAGRWLKKTSHLLGRAALHACQATAQFTRRALAARPRPTRPE